MKLGTGVAILAAIIASATSAQTLRPTKADLKALSWNAPYRSYPNPAVIAWENDLRRALNETKKPDAAADAIADRHGLSSADMRRLVNAWIIAWAREDEGPRKDKAWQTAVRNELIALLPHIRQSPIGLPLVAETLASIEECSAEDFAAMMAGSTAPAADAFHIADAATCGDNFERAALAAGGGALPALIRHSNYGDLPLSASIPLYAWLTSPAALARIDEADRAALATLLWQRYLGDLFRARLHQRALRLLDALPADLRTNILSPTFRPPATAKVDDVTMTFETDDAVVSEVDVDAQDKAVEATADAMDAAIAAIEGKAGAEETGTEPHTSPPRRTQRHSSISAPILDVAEALALAGRDAEARTLLAILPGLAEARTTLRCYYAFNGGQATECPEYSDLPMKALFLDHYLDDPQADPYPIAETVLATDSAFGGPVNMGILCRLFPAKDFPDLCDETETHPLTIAELSETHALDDEQDDDFLERVVPGFAALRAEVLTEASPETTASRKSTGERLTVVATPPPFVEGALPSVYEGGSKTAPPSGLAALPDGYELVRAERNGKRAVAISISQTYDPTGEISGGGYWVHLSDDGGKHWATPLYTGLAEHFPYVVQRSSRMPLLDGDKLTLAVDIAEIDTASISYPPVGLRTRRRAANRYLEIPLADLRRDSNDDGLTDLAARHLLLDRPRGPNETPFLLGSDSGAQCPATISNERKALIGLLGKLQDPSSRALIEPMDRAEKEFMADWRSAAAPTDRPIFILGRAEDFTCLRSRRPIIVYGKEDITALERFTPAFHAFQMPSIIFNRARDRGYVRWSTGWAGGTFQMRLIDGAWQFKSITEWIT